MSKHRSPPWVSSRRVIVVGIFGTAVATVAVASAMWAPRIEPDMPLQLPTATSSRPTPTPTPTYETATPPSLVPTSPAVPHYDPAGPKSTTPRTSTRPRQAPTTPVAAGRPAPPPQPPPPSATNQPNEALGLIELVNRARIQHQLGCPVGPLSPDLQDQAQEHAYRQASEDRMHHSDGPDGFGTWGENVAFGPSTAQEVHDFWMDSYMHRKIILDCTYNYLGVGAADAADGTRYWVEMFVRHDS